MPAIPVIFGWGRGSVDLATDLAVRNFTFRELSGRKQETVALGGCLWYTDHLRTPCREHVTITLSGVAGIGGPLQ